MKTQLLACFSGAALLTMAAGTSAQSLSYYVFRGAGAVTFSPPQIKVWEDTRAGANSPWAPICGAADARRWQGDRAGHVLRARNVSEQPGR